MEDWCALVPETGLGLLLIQFQVSPPSPPETAPLGRESSTQRPVLTPPFVFVTGGLLVVVTGGLFVVVTGGFETVLPSLMLELPLTEANTPWLGL